MSKYLAVCSLIKREANPAVTRIWATHLIARGVVVLLSTVSLTACGGEFSKSGRPPTANAMSTLTVTVSGTGGGTVTGGQGAITCSPTCSATFSTGTQVTLTAAPAAGSVLGGWGGPCSGVATCTLTVSGNTSVAITFTAISGSTAIPPTFFALNDTNSGDNPGSDGMSYGAMSHPVALAWNTIEQKQGSYDFSIFDGFAQIAPSYTASDGSKVAILVLTLGLTPPWATSNPASCWTPEGSDISGCTDPPASNNLSYWTDFITALVNHYNGNTAPHIRYYEIWNEASSDVYFTGTPQQLATLATAAYPILKQDPNSLVITPSMVGNGSSPTSSTSVFLAEFLAAGGNQADIASFHGYLAPMDTSPFPLPGEGCTGSECNGSIIALADGFRLTYNQNGMQGKPLFDTEGGLAGVNISDMDQRSGWLAQYYVLQASLFNSDQLQFVSWFTWGTVSDLGGTIEAAGNVPNPVGVAYNQVYNWLVGNTFTATPPCSESGTIWTCALTGASGYKAEIIWDDSQTCTAVANCTTSNQSVPSSFVQSRDLAGNSTPIQGSVPVGLEPIILENQ
jgi:hypothetical protein